MSDGWKNDAACKRLPYSLFFPPDVVVERGGWSPEAGKRICADCPVMAQCLRDALTSRHPSHGVLGHTTQFERGQMAKQAAALCQMSDAALCAFVLSTTRWEMGYNIHGNVIRMLSLSERASA